MAVPKPIHQFLQKRSFRHVGRGSYWCLYENKPVAKTVCIDSHDSAHGKTFQISLHLAWPSESYLNFSEKLCTDGLLRPQTADARLNKLYDYSFDYPDCALKNLDDLMNYWFGVIGNPAIMLDLFDFWMGINSTPPHEFSSIQEHCIANRIPRVEGAAVLYEKICYLLIAERFAEAENILSRDDRVLNLIRTMTSDYPLLLDSVKQKKIVAPQEFLDFVEKKKVLKSGFL